MIHFGDKPPMSIEDFLRNCQRLLSRDDYACIEKLLTKSNPNYIPKNAFYHKCVKFEHCFRTELTCFRADRAGKDPMDFVSERECNPFIIDVIAQAAEEENLLEAERILDRYKWQVLDDLLQGHHLDFECILVYGLKLQILERHNKINSLEGEKKYKELRKKHIKEELVGLI